MRIISVQGSGEIVFNSVNVKQGEVLAGKRPLAVMLLLIPDIVSERCVVGAADSKRRISVLPPEVPSMGKGLMNPAGTIRLDGADQLRDWGGCGRFDVEVHVIPYPSGA
jgi:hypothetical protein